MTKVERQRNKALAHRLQAQEIMGCECNYCSGSHKLEYHHENPATKEFNVAQYFGRIAWERLEAELMKCIVLCRECHEETFSKVLH